MESDKILDEIWKARHPEDALFLDIIDGYILKVSKEYHERLFYIKDDKMLIDYNKKTNEAWINLELIWDVFETKFDLNYDEIQKLMNYLLETHLNFMKITSYWSNNNFDITYEKII